MSAVPSIQDLLTQVQAMQATLEKLASQASQASPAPAPAPAPASALAQEFAQAVHNRNWVRARYLLLDHGLGTDLCWTPDLAQNLFGPHVILRDDDVEPNQLLLWREIACHVPFEALEVLNSPQWIAELIMTCVVHDTKEGVLTDWVKFNKSPQAFRAILTRIFDNDEPGTDLDLVGWMVHCANRQGLENLWNLRDPAGRLVFTRDSKSSWAWPKFYGELACKCCRDFVADPTSGTFQCLKFWFDVVAKEMVIPVSA